MSKFGRANEKLKRAREVQAKCRQKEQDIDEELKQLEERKKWLGTLRKLNRGQHKDWLEGLHGRAIGPYCQTWNRQFAEEMQRRLPVELRNMIYGYIWEDSLFAAFPDVRKVAGGRRSVGDGRRPTLVLPHFIDPSFVGMTTARETVRAYYDAAHLTGNMIVVPGPEHIKAAATKDVFGVGLDPGVHLRSLIVKIDLDRLRTPRPTHLLSSNCHHTNADKIYTKRSELKEWLRALLYIKHKSGFMLFLELYQYNIRVAVIEEVLSVLREVFLAMKARGARVYVDWTYRGEWLDDQWEYPLDYDMEEFFVLPRRIWRQNMLGFLSSAADEDLISPDHGHFFNEPCQHVSNNVFVHHMWSNDEHDPPTCGEESDDELDSESDSGSDLNSNEVKEEDSDL